MGLAASRAPGRASFEVAAAAFLPEPFVAVDDQLFPQENFLDAARHGAALEQGVIDAAMMRRGADGPSFLGIEHHDIGIRSRGDRPLCAETGRTVLPAPSPLAPRNG
jgi:hypothetical protein